MAFSTHLYYQSAITYAQIYYVFGFLWSYNWVVAIGQTTVAGAVATWYWSQEKRVSDTFFLHSALSKPPPSHVI